MQRSWTGLGETVTPVHVAHRDILPSTAPRLGSSRRRTRQAADSGAGAVEDPVRLAGAKRPRRGGKLAALANLVSVVEEPDLAVGQPVAAAAPAAAVPAAAAAPPVAPAALPAPAVLSDPPQPKPALVIETDDPIIRSNEAEMFSHFCMVEVS